MVHMVDMQLRNMFDTQLKIKYKTHLKQLGIVSIVKLKQFLIIAFMQISTNLFI